MIIHIWLHSENIRTWNVNVVPQVGHRIDLNPYHKPDPPSPWLHVTKVVWTEYLGEITVDVLCEEESRESQKPLFPDRKSFRSKPNQE